MEPLVSILIPAYNSEKHIAATLESALAQTWSRKEIIVVDDGSRDRTREIAAGFACRGVRVIHQANQGAAAARNKAFAASKGDYIQWLDADDLLSPDKVELQVKAALASGDPRLLLSSGWAYFIHRPKKANFAATALWNDLTPAEWLIRKLEHNLHMQTATWLVSRQLTEAAGPWDTRLLGDDDGEYFCRVLLASKGVRFVPGPKVYYRRSLASLSYIGHSTKKIEAQFLSMQMHIRYLRSIDDSARTRAACLKYLQGYSIFFYPEMPHVMEQARKIAAELGGDIVPPRLPWKYDWIRRIFGWDLAKRAWVFLPRFRESFVRRWDGLMWRLESTGSNADPRQASAIAAQS